MFKNNKINTFKSSQIDFFIINKFNASNKFEKLFRIDPGGCALI